MRIAKLIRIMCALTLAAMASVNGSQLACAQDAPDRRVVRPVERANNERANNERANNERANNARANNARANNARARQRGNVPAQSRQAQVRGGAARRHAYRAVNLGYYPYPYPYRYFSNPYPYYYGAGYNGYATGGPYYQYQVPNPYAFGSSVTYGFSQPGGYRY